MQLFQLYFYGSLIAGIRYHLITCPDIILVNEMILSLYVLCNHIEITILMMTGNAFIRMLSLLTWESYYTR